VFKDALSKCLKYLRAESDQSVRFVQCCRNPSPLHPKSIPWFSPKVH